MTRLPAPLRFRPALLLVPCLLLGCSALPESRPRDVLAIGAVQGHEARSPMVGASVTVEGVVTLRRNDGWFLQDGGDGDEATSDALFVADMDASVTPGDRVRVRGTVAELDAGKGGGTRTALVQAQVRALGTNNLVPTTLARTPLDWERWEGMTVRIRAPLQLADSGDLGKRNRVLASLDGRLWQPTERATPGSDAARDIATDNARRSLWIEPANDAQWPTELKAARAGSRLDNAAGVIDPAGAGARLLLTAPPTLHAAQRPAPPTVPGHLRIAAFNLENLFNGDGRGGGFPTPRGARTPQELTAQLAKHVATLRGLDADVVALMELENDGYGPHSSLVTLVDALNADGGRWRFVDAGRGPGDNAIRVGLIYRDDRVRTAGKPVVLEGGPFGPHSRVPLAQAFVRVENGRARGPSFVVVANHFKSKGCSGAEGADRDQKDGAACWNATRVASAHRLDAWVRDRLREQPRVLLVGDFNAYAQEAPLRTLRDAGWRDAFDVAGAVEPYSYVYDGQLGRLDHALLSPALATHLRGAAEWHSNADEPDASGYRAGGEGPWRSSDHDPLLLGFDL